MFAYVLSPDALQDLQDIWDFIAPHNPRAADRLEGDFFKACDMLAERPRMGHTRSDITQRDVRFWPVGSYLIVYRIGTTDLEVVAILHGARDIAEVIKKR